MALGCAALVYTCAVFVAWTLRNNRPGGVMFFTTTAMMMTASTAKKTRRVVVRKSTLPPPLSAAESARRQNCAACRWSGLNLTDRTLNSVQRLNTRPVRVAVCFAGAWREWNASWGFVKRHIVDALDADVYAVSDTDRFGTPYSGEHGSRADTGFTVHRMRMTFGQRFRAGEHLSTDEASDVRGRTWPEISRAQSAGLRMFP
jgi:hypothetical protein